MTTHTHADLIAELRDAVFRHRTIPLAPKDADLISRAADALQSSEGKATEEFKERTTAEVLVDIGAAIEAALECSAIDWVEDIKPSKRGQEDDDEARCESKNMVHGLLSDAKDKIALLSRSAAPPSEGEGPGATDDPYEIAAEAYLAVLRRLQTPQFDNGMGARLGGDPDAFAEIAPSPPVSREADELGKWLSAALDDPNVCDAMKADINAWFNAGQPVPSAAVDAVLALLQPLAGRNCAWQQLRAANTERQLAWTEGAGDPGLLFHAVELGGEAGEVLNVAKKIVRERSGWRGSRATVADLAEELADVIICADKLAASEGIDLWPSVVAKFNATSEKVGLPHRLPAPPPAEGK